MGDKATRSTLDGMPSGLSSALLRCNSIAELRALAPLPDEAQRLIDNAVVNVGLSRLTIAADVMAAGLTFPLADPLSVMELYWEKQNKVGHAQRTMLPNVRGENQMLQRTGERIPIYATMDDFAFNIRVLRAAERAGVPLDTSHVEQAVRRVNEAIEDSIINGAGIQVGGNSAPGLLNAPNANTENFIDAESWTAANHSGEDILADVLELIEAAQQDKKYGPYNLYVPTAYDLKLNNDFKANSDKSIRSRLEELVVGGRNLVIKGADMMPADTVVLVQMTSDVVQMIVGQEPTVISWEDGPGWERKFAVLAFMVPRVRDDYDGQSGIVIGTPT